MKEGILSKRVKAQYKKRDKIIEEFLRIYPDPVIKGDITEGKILWRGLRLVVRRNNHVEQCWIEQRGIQISPEITTKLLPLVFRIFIRSGDMQEAEIHYINLRNG